jgi:hypothetical protein
MFHLTTIKMEDTMTKKSWERSAAVVRTLPGEIVLKAASHCSGHNILDPKAFSDAGIPAEVVTHLTRNYKSDGSPKGSIYVGGKPVKSLEGIYGLDALRFFASALGVEYRDAIGRGFEAANIHRALQSHFQCAKGKSTKKDSL